MWLALAIVWLLSVGYMGSQLKRGWVPHDEGTLGQSAERVLNGELPHRDFDDVYTGGLTYVYALAMRAFGMNLVSPRIVLFLFFAAWVPVVFYAASRFMGLYAASGITLTAIAWSVPNYPAAMPSWYNLFFATFGVAALLRYLEVDSAAWLFVAGLCGGLSMLAKISGIYYVAGVFLFFLFREQSLNESDHAVPSHIYRWTSIGGLTALVVVCFRLVASSGYDRVIYFALPVFVLAGAVADREFARHRATDGERFRILFSMVVPFCVGVAAPVAAFLAPYIRSGSVPLLVEDVFILPARRFLFARLAPPAPDYMLTAVLPVLLLVFWGYVSKSRRDRLIYGAVAAIALTAVLFFSATAPQLYRLAWFSQAASVPVIVLLGSWFLRDAVKSIHPSRQQQLMVVFSAVALTSLIQFPFAAAIYFCYVAPLTILAIAVLFASLERPPRFLLGSIAAFYLLFAILRVTPTFIFQMGYTYTANTENTPLSLPRAGGIRVKPEEAALYNELIPLIQSHAVGEYMYATPDCPEVYFLSGMQNPTATLFEFMDRPQSGKRDPVLVTLDALRTHQVNVVAINKAPAFSSQILSPLKRDLDAIYPHSAEVGHFEVRWK